MKKDKYQKEELSPETEITAQEEFEEGEEKGQGFIQKNSNVIIIAAVVVIAIVGILFYLRYKNNEDSKKASLYLSRATGFYETGEWQKALDGDKQTTVRGEPVRGLKEIVEEYGGTEPGKTAALYAGKCLVNLDNAKEAEDYFEKAQSADSKIVQAGGVAGMATVLETEGKYKEAAEKYIEAASMKVDDNTNARFSFYAALCYEKANDKENAGKYFKQIVKSENVNEFTPMAKAGLIRIGMIIE